jgi:hypothetical protein
VEPHLPAAAAAPTLAPALRRQSVSPQGRVWHRSGVDQVGEDFPQHKIGEFVAGFGVGDDFLRLRAPAADVRLEGLDQSIAIEPLGSDAQLLRQELGRDEFDDVRFVVASRRQRFRHAGRPWARAGASGFSGRENGAKLLRCNTRFSLVGRKRQ